MKTAAPLKLGKGDKEDTGYVSTPVTVHWELIVEPPLNRHFEKLKCCRWAGPPKLDEIRIRELPLKESVLLLILEVGELSRYA